MAIISTDQELFVFDNKAGYTGQNYVSADNVNQLIGLTPDAVSAIENVSGKMDESLFSYNADNLITAYNNSAFAGQGGSSGITASVNGGPVDSLEFITNHSAQEGERETNPTINGEVLWIYHAEHAHSADTAVKAVWADTATNASHATNADYANTVGHTYNADYATNAQNDGNGNDIVRTYARKDETVSIDLFNTLYDMITAISAKLPT